MNQMNHKALILSIPVMLALLFGGWFLSREPKSVSESQNPPVVKENSSQVADQNRLQHIEPILGNSDEVWYAIPEMGVRMKLNKEFAEDLSYGSTQGKNSLDGEWNSLYLSLINLAKIAPDCTGWNYGSLFRYEGDLEELKRQKDELDLYLATRLDEYIQVGNYYYGWVGPQDVCWNASMEEKVRQVFPGRYSGSGAKNVIEGIKTLELIP